MVLVENMLNMQSWRVNQTSMALTFFFICHIKQLFTFMHRKDVKEVDRNYETSMK